MAEKVGAEWNLSAGKRAFDVGGLSAIVPVFGPIALASAGMIKTVDRMRPIYSSTRYGLAGEPFTVYKLRTRTEDTPEMPSNGSNRDTGLTGLGAILRKAHFDEIPQAINIYRGEMSLVGPRPLILQDMEDTMDVLSSNEQKDWLWARSTAKPAPFGPFQLEQHNNGYYEEEALYRRAMSDINYASTATMSGDIKLLRDSVKDGLASFLGVTNTPERIRGQRGADLFALAATQFGVAITDKEIRYWQSAFMLARTIDDLVDEDGVNDIDSALLDALSGKIIGNMSEDEAVRLKDTFETMLPVQRQAWILSCQALPYFQQAQKGAKTPKQLATVRHAESVLFARMLELPVDGAADESCRRMFNQWVYLFSEAAYAADNVVDLKSDYQNGLSGVTPSLGNHLRMAAESVGISLKAVATTPPAAYATIAGVAMRGLFFS